MAKVSMLQREKKRAKLVARYAQKRAELKAIIANPDTDPDERVAAMFKLTSLPRDSAKTRQRNRCSVTGRPHGYYRKFGLSRNKLRENVMKGNVPGMKKSSW